MDFKPLLKYFFHPASFFKELKKKTFHMPFLTGVLAYTIMNFIIITNTRALHINYSDIPYFLGVVIPAMLAYSMLTLYIYVSVAYRIMTYGLVRTLKEYTDEEVEEYHKTRPPGFIDVFTVFCYSISIRLFYAIITFFNSTLLMYSVSVGVFHTYLMTFAGIRAYSNISALRIVIAMLWPFFLIAFFRLILFFGIHLPFTGLIVSVLLSFNLPPLMYMFYVI